MADVEITAKLELEEGDMKKAGDTFVNQLKSGLEKTLSRFNLGAKEGESGGLSATGAVAIGGAVAGAVASVVG